MRTSVIRFTFKLVFIGAILFSGGSVLFTEYTDRITTPIFSYATISKLPILTELQNQYYSAICLKLPYENAFNSDVSGTIKIPPPTIENTESDIHDLVPPDTTIAELSAEQSSYDIDTIETPSEKNIEKTEDTKITDTPAEQVLTKIRTKIKYVETILKKAVIKPYHINGQIEGLQINGLDRILVAKDLLLKSGDIIRSVNGHSLSSKKRAYEVFKKAREFPTMEIELLRNGESTTLLYFLK